VVKNKNKHPNKTKRQTVIFQKLKKFKNVLCDSNKKKIYWIDFRRRNLIVYYYPSKGFLLLLHSLYVLVNDTKP